MRALAGLVGLAAVLAGCTAGFPTGARLLAELQVGNLGPGERASQPFRVEEREGFLFAGMRTGPMEHVHVALRSPGGALYDTASRDRAGACAVREPEPGPWLLEVWADAFDGSLRGGKFTARAAPGEPPGLLPCADEAFPARGRSVTLAARTLNVTASATEEFPFEQPYELAGLAAVARGANASALVAAPGGDFVRPEQASSPIAKGTWRARVTVEAPANASWVSVTIAVQGVGL